MSFNIYLKAEFTVELPYSCRAHTFVERFILSQTPTDATFKILESPRPDLKYINWIKDNHLNNDWKEHLKELRKWLKDHNRLDGWNVEWYYL